MLYYNFSDDQLNEAHQQISKGLTEKDFIRLINQFNEKHYYATCTVCHNEYKYFDSPVLRDEIWDTILNNVGLSEFQKKIYRERDFFQHVKTKYKTVDEQLKYFDLKFALSVADENHCTLCVSCMEKALNRPLQLTDIETSCQMGYNFAKNKNWI